MMVMKKKKNLIRIKDNLGQLGVMAFWRALAEIRKLFIKYHSSM